MYMVGWVWVSRVGRTFGVKLFVEAWVVFLKPVFAFFRCAAEFAVLGLVDQPVILSLVLRSAFKHYAEVTAGCVPLGVECRL